MKKINFKIILQIILLVLINSSFYYLAKIIQGPALLLDNSIDQKIPFIEHFVYFYIIWYPLLIIIPYIFYQSKKETFKKYGILYILCAITTNIIYIIIPTTMTRAIIANNNISQQIVNIIYYLDTPAVNCLPSMHCICCFLFMFVAASEKKIEKKKKRLIMTISTLIILSTLFIKQHVLYDVISAFIIVLIYNTIYEILTKRKKGI
jgi:membrane-associated phospholipid phosphatase